MKSRMRVSCLECYPSGPRITIAILSTPGRCRFLLAMGHFVRIRPKPRCDPNRNRRSGPLPPGEVRVRFRASVVPLVRLCRKLEIRGVAVAVNHIKAVLSLVVVPLAPRIIFVAIRPPRPIALNKLVGRTASDLARFDRRGERELLFPRQSELPALRHTSPWRLDPRSSP